MTERVFDASSPVGGNTPTSRRTAINMVSAIARTAAGAVRLGNLDQDLCQKWKCISDSCSNVGNYCYRIASGDHYAMKPLDIQAWGNDISNGRAATLERPSEVWFARLLKNGAVGLSRRPNEVAEKKSVASKIDEMRVKMEEIEMRAQMRYLKELEGQYMKQMKEDLELE